MFYYMKPYQRHIGDVAGVEASFQPDFYIDISNQIDYKVNALREYKSQIEGNDLDLLMQ